MLSETNGDFDFENVPAFDSLQILLSAVGYNVYSDYFSFANTNAIVMLQLNMILEILKWGTLQKNWKQ